MKKNEIGHIEIQTSDLKTIQAFLAEMFGWKFEEMGENYCFFSTPGALSGGIEQVEKVEPGKSPIFYVAVDSIDNYLGRVEGAGGSIHAPKAEIPGQGWCAHLKDKDGTIYGLYEPLNKEDIEG